MAVTIIPKSTNGAIKRLIALFVLSLMVSSKLADMFRNILISFGYY